MMIVLGDGLSTVNEPWQDRGGPTVAKYNRCTQQVLRVPETQVQSTVTGLIKCSQTNIPGDTHHLSTWRPPHTTVI